MIRGLRQSVALLLASLLLTSCGGGGTNSSISTGTTGTGSSGTTTTPTLTISLVDSNGDSTTRISTSSPATVVAQVDGATDNSVIVSFSTTLGQINPSSATALTDSSGQATIGLEAGTTSGAGTVTATATIDGSAVTSNSIAFEVLPFDVVQDGLSIGTCGSTSATWDCTSGGTFTAGNLYIASANIAARGTAPLGLVVQNTNGDPVQNVAVNFTSRCTNLTDSGGKALASISGGTSDVNGVVKVTYQASGCEGNDTITASEPTSGGEATGVINVYSPIIGSIVFDGVTDSAGTDIDTIYISGAGGESTARVSFKVVDRFGDPVDGKDVNFALTSEIGGVSLQTDTGLTDSNGIATAFVNSGYIATTVQVLASIEVDTTNDGNPDTTLSTTSSKLSINTGIADEDSMSLSASTLNVEGEAYDGETSTITVRLSDAFNNPVPDGTSVQFRTEYGRITPACTTSGGNCSVTWNSQEPRRPLDPNVNVPTVSDGTCPMALISDEPVTIASGAGATQYTVGTVYRVEHLPSGESETAGTDYNMDLTGIQCVDGSDLCQPGRTVSVTGTPFGTEDVTIDSSGHGSTSIAPVTITSVTNYEFALASGTDYTVTADGISCVSGSAWCADGMQVQISYTRAYLDEDASGDTTHTISHPGVPTAPFYARTNVPCPAARRSTSVDAAGYNGGLGQVYGARSTVLAFAQGEESFTDTNGNGQYDFGEPFVDLPEAFLDTNEDGVFGNGDPNQDDSRDISNPTCYGPTAPLSSSNPANLDKCFQEGGDEDVFIDFNSDGKYNAGNGIYNGTLCPKAVSDRTSVCSGTSCTSSDRYCTRELVSIRKKIIILSSSTSSATAYRDSSTGEYVDYVSLAGDPAAGMFDSNSTVYTNDGRAIASGTDFTIGFDDGDVPYGVSQDVYLRSGSGGIYVEVSGQFSELMPLGTSLAAKTDACDAKLGSTTVLNGNSGYTATSLSLTIPSAINNKAGSVTVEATTPNGTVSASNSVYCRVSN